MDNDANTLPKLAAVSMCVLNARPQPCFYGDEIADQMLVYFLNQVLSTGQHIPTMFNDVALILVVEKLCGNNGTVLSQGTFTTRTNLECKGKYLKKVPGILSFIPGAVAWFWKHRISKANKSKNCNGIVEDL